MHVTTAGELRYPWLPPIADLCTQRQPALAYVASVSSRVMLEIGAGAFFCSLSSFLDELAWNRLLRRLTSLGEVIYSKIPGN